MIEGHVRACRVRRSPPLSQRRPAHGSDVAPWARCPLTYRVTAPSGVCRHAANDAAIVGEVLIGVPTRRPPRTSHLADDRTLPARTGSPITHKRPDIERGPEEPSVSEDTPQTRRFVAVQMRRSAGLHPLHNASLPGNRRYPMRDRHLASRAVFGAPFGHAPTGQRPRRGLC